MPRRSALRDLSPSALIAGFVAVLVGYTSSAVIIFQAAEAVGAGPLQVGAWLSMLGLGMGVTSMGLPLYYCEPVLTRLVDAGCGAARSFWCLRWGWSAA